MVIPSHDGEHTEERGHCFPGALSLIGSLSSGQAKVNNVSSGTKEIPRVLLAFK